MAVEEKIDTGLAPENKAVSNGGKDAVKPEKTAKPRMLEQDIAKGIAIILVMALHTLTISKDIYNILGGLFGFIMPFFFFYIWRVTITARIAILTKRSSVKG